MRIAVAYGIGSADKCRHYLLWRSIDNLAKTLNDCYKTSTLGLSQILCKHRRAMQNRAKII